MKLSVSDLLLYGKQNAVSRLYLAGQTGLDERIVRQHINRLRLCGAPIISGNAGYHLTDDPLEAESFARSMLHRAHEISRVADAMLCTADRLRGQARMEGW